MTTLIRWWYNIHAMRRTTRRDPVTPALMALLLHRDGGCVASRIGFDSPCGSQFGPGGRIVLEVDHVHTAGLGRRGPSTPENTVLLCGWHHRMKTEHANAWRPRLDRWIAEHPATEEVA